MSTLQSIFINVRTATPGVVLQQLNDHFSASNINRLRFSERMTDTAMQSITLILLQIVRKLRNAEEILWEKDLDQNKCAFLKFFITIFNQPEHLRRKVAKSFNSREYVRDRGLNAIFVLDEVSSLTSPAFAGPVLEPTPSDPPSRLWLKLQAAGSVGALIDGKGKEKCPICIRAHVTLRNFCVLDNCNHHFCAQCIATVFEKT